MVLIDNLICYYKLDEASGSVLDAHGSYDLTNSGATPNVSGKINTAYDFDGSADYIKSDATIDMSGNSGKFSFSFWFRPDSVTSYRTLIQLGNGQENNQKGLLITMGNPSGEFKLFTSEGSFISQASSGAGLTTGNWYHVVVIGNGTNIKIYLNDSLVDTWVNSFTFSTVRNLVMGAHDYGPFEWRYDGKIDEVAVFNRDISSSEVTELYNSGNGLAYPFAVPGTNMKINIADNFKDIDSMQINIGNVWKDVIEVQQNIGDAWKTVF